MKRYLKTAGILSNRRAEYFFISSDNESEEFFKPYTKKINKLIEIAESE
jgi:hypothetical protein